MPTSPTTVRGSRVSRALWAALLGLLAAAAAMPATALPLFARQTGQSCATCHAGGQFPELTPFGRYFKLTGYTLGTRATVPLAVMAVASASHVANTSKSDSPQDDFDKNNDALLATISAFAGGKIAEHVGGFAQLTFDPYASRDDAGRYHGHTQADNIDLRWADQFSLGGHGLIVGSSLNNNPSLSDPWNTAPAWMQYVPVPSPTSSRFIDGNSPYPSHAVGGNVAGLTVYTLVDDTVYAELGGYATAQGVLRVLRAGVAGGDVTRLRGLAPYARLAWTPSWGDHHLMLGFSGMQARVYDDPLDTSDPASSHHIADWHLDAQYQWLQDPHAVTAQFVYSHTRHRYPAAQAGQAVGFVDARGGALALTSAADTARLLRAKVSYAHQARVGGSVALFDLRGSANTALQTAGYDPVTGSITSDPAAQAPSQRVAGNLSGRPDTRGSTLELFWLPLQEIRLGVQYTVYQRFNGAAHNYDGFGRNASDNNSVFAYAWVAY
jgi:hypothetical protein